MADWLDVSSTVPRISYTATAAQTAFTVPFVFFADADLLVYQNAILKTLATHYTVTGAEVATGGTVTLLTGATAGDIILIARDIAIVQTTHIPPSGPLDVAAMNFQTSKLIAIDQQLDNKLDRTLHFPDSDPTASGELASQAARAGKLIGFDSTGAVIYTTGPTFVSSTFVGVAVVDTRSTAAVTTFAISVNVVRTEGLTAAGDGGGSEYIRGLVSDPGSFSDGGGVFWKPVAYVDTGDLLDKSVTLAKLYHPTAASRLLGTDSNAALTITGAVSNGGPNLIRLTVASTATFATGQKKTVSDVLGTIEANATWTITVIDATHIDLQGSVFAHTYVSGGTIGGGVEEISLGNNLTLTGSVLSAASAALAGAQGLIIANNPGTPNSKIDVFADQVVLINPTGNLQLYTTLFISGATIDTAINGALGLDTGTRAASTWYNIFFISDGASMSAMASLSATTPTMPGSYVYKLRIGAMRTDGSGNFLRSRQVGNDTQFIVTAATNTATLPVMVAEGGTITFWTALSVSNFVPPTATRIRVVAYVAQNAAAIVGALAPNNSYPTSAVTNQFSASNFQATGLANKLSLQADMLLESTNIYYGGVQIGVSCQGWKDKVNAS